MIKTTVLWRNFEFTVGKKRRFLEQADCLIIASDTPSAEINNAARFARLHSKPIIDLNTADMHFRR